MCISEKHTIEFQSAGADERYSVRGPCGIRAVNAHEHLFYEGDARTHFFVIDAGWVKLYRTLIDGQRQAVGFCNAGSVIGLEAGDDHMNGCEAVTPVRVRAIPLSQMVELCHSDPDLGDQLLRQMGRQLGSAQAHLTTVGAQTADQKLASFLIAFADSENDGTDEFDMPMRRSDIAEFLGLRLETISRKLSDFQRRGWIKMLSLYRCQLVDREALDYLAEGGAVDEVAHCKTRH